MRQALLQIEVFQTIFTIFSFRPRVVVIASRTIAPIDLLLMWKPVVFCFSAFALLDNNYR